MPRAVPTFHLKNHRAEVQQIPAPHKQETSAANLNFPFSCSLWKKKKKSQKFWNFTFTKAPDLRPRAGPVPWPFAVSASREDWQTLALTALDDLARCRAAGKVTTVLILIRSVLALIRASLEPAPAPSPAAEGRLDAGSSPSPDTQVPTGRCSSQHVHKMAEKTPSGEKALNQFQNGLAVSWKS